MQKQLQTIFCSVIFCSCSLQFAYSQDEKTEAGAQKDAQSAPRPVTVDEVRKLVRQLEESALAERDAAEKLLVEMGSGVLSFLPEINSSTSGEMKIRLQRIRQQLQMTNVVGFFEPSKVTLNGTFQLKDVLEKLEEQTQNKVTIQNGDAYVSKEIVLDVKDADFWVVIMEIISQAKLQINLMDVSESLVLIPAAESEDDSIESPEPRSFGAFWLQPISVQSSKAFRTRLPGTLDVSLMVAWEPRMKPVFMQVPMASVEATIDDEKQIASVSPQSVPEVPLVGSGCSTQIDLQLARPDRSARKISSLKGELMVAIPGDKHQYIFKNFANGARQAQKFGDVSVTLEGARRNGSVFETRLLIEFGDAEGALDSFRGWILSNHAFLKDPKDRSLENVGYQTYAVTSNSVGIAYLFQINGNPDEFQLIYESPSIITQQPVKYELNDITLP